MNRREILAMAILASAILWGCDAPAQFNAQQNLEQSEAVYARCVASNGTGTADCEASKHNYESSEQVYDRTSSKIQLGPPEEEQPADSNWTH